MFNTAATSAEKMLDKNMPCADLFGGTAASAKSTLESATYIYNAIVNEDGTGVLGENYYAVTNPSTKTVTINYTGHFFDNGSSKWNGVTLNGAETRAFVLLHELGHLTGALGDDRENQTISDNFNRSILRDCFGKSPTE